MTTLLSLDGGNAKKNDRASYLAAYEGGELRRVTAVTLQSAREEACYFAAGAVAVEKPDYLKPGVPPATVFALAWNVCRIAYTLAQGAPVHEYTVSAGLKTDWIGSVQKPVLHQRIWAALSEAERRCFPASAQADIDRASEHFARTKKILTSHASFNTLDAAGVGLFHLGRIKKGGARP